MTKSDYALVFAISVMIGGWAGCSGVPQPPIAATPETIAISVAEDTAAPALAAEMAPAAEQALELPSPDAPQMLRTACAASDPALP